MSAGGAVHAPPLSAAEALSSLLWQPYECRSPPLARSRTEGAIAARPQSPSGGRNARASYRATTYLPDMRLPVPAPAPAPEPAPVPLRKCDSVTVRVPGEPSVANVSSVRIVPVPEVTVTRNVNSAVQTERERNVASAECQTEEPAARRRRARRARLARCAPLGLPPSAGGVGPRMLEASLPPPPYSTLPPPPPPPALLAGAQPVLAPPPPPVPSAHRFPFQPIPLR